MSVGEGARLIFELDSSRPRRMTRGHQPTRRPVRGSWRRSTPSCPHRASAPHGAEGLRHHGATPPGDERRRPHSASVGRARCRRTVSRWRISRRSGRSLSKDGTVLGVARPGPPLAHPLDARLWILKEARGPGWPASGKETPQPLSPWPVPAGRSRRHLGPPMSALSPEPPSPPSRLEQPSGRCAGAPLGISRGDLARDGPGPPFVCPPWRRRGGRKRPWRPPRLAPVRDPIRACGKGRTSPPVSGVAAGPAGRRPPSLPEPPAVDVSRPSSCMRPRARRPMGGCSPREVLRHDRRAPAPSRLGHGAVQCDDPLARVPPSARDWRPLPRAPGSPPG